MENLRIAVVGLPVEDSLVVRSTLRFMGNEKCRWRCVEDESDADLMLYRVPTDAPHDAPGEPAKSGHIQRFRLDVGSTFVDVAGTDLTSPLRSRDLVPHMRRVESSVGRLDVRPTGKSTILGNSRFVTFLLSGRSSLGRSSTVLRIGPYHELVIDSMETAALSDPLALRWRSWSIPNLRSLCDRVHKGAAVSLAGASPARVESSIPLCTGTVRKLVWALALFDPQPLPAMTLLPGARLSLRRWPDFGDLPLYGSQMRMAALLARGPISLEHFTSRANAPKGEIVAFLNACHWLKYLVVGTAKLDSAADSLAVVQAMRPAQGWGTLVQSIRTALRAGSVRSELP